MSSLPLLFVTIGPSSLNTETLRLVSEEKVNLLRINLSHTPLEKLEQTIQFIQDNSDVPVCLDSEGAQIRNELMANGSVVYIMGDTVKIHFDEVLGDAHNISFTPKNIAKELELGVGVRVDFNSVYLRVFEKNKDFCLAKVERGGSVGNKKATDFEMKVHLAPITEKDRKSIRIGKKMGIKDFALSFASGEPAVKQMRELVGTKSAIISKIECLAGLNNLLGIMGSSDQILIDRGDLSRQVPIAQIPFLQRRIISMARSKSVPVLVATNLLESMVKSLEPTRAEVNDVVSTLLMGANGLVLAAETAVGDFPVESVRMINQLIDQFQRWTPNTSINEILDNYPAELFTRQHLNIQHGA